MLNRHDPCEFMMTAVDIPDGVNSLLVQHALNGAQRQSDGAALHVELLRNNFAMAASFSQAMAMRVSEESGSGMSRALPYPGAMPGATKIPGT